jgi:hypothetical protein
MDGDKMKIITPNEASGSVEWVLNANPVFSQWLKDAMEQKGEFDFRAHLYLTGIMTEYTCLDKTLATVQDNKEDPIALQFSDITGDMMKDRSYKYLRFKSLGDSMLFTVGFFPEAFNSISARPSIDYYVSMGEASYSRAAATVSETSHTHNQAELMNMLSTGFKRYAGILLTVRQDMADMPLLNKQVVTELAGVIGDKGILDKYRMKKDSMQRRQ